MPSFQKEFGTFSRTDASERMEKVFFALCKNCDTPVALGAWLRFKYGEHEQLARFGIHPKSYRSDCFFDAAGERFRRDYLVSSYLSKYKGLKTGIDTAQEAISAFKQAEDRCREVNRRLRTLRGKPTRFEPIILLAQRKIAYVLGDHTCVTSKDCGWGPGATFSLHGRKARLDNKMREKRISVTRATLPLAQSVIGSDIHWVRSRGIPADGPCTLLSSEFEVVRGNRLETVPKNSKTDRCIAIEPTANIFLQKAVGKHIRRGLLHAGVDLNSQTRNQILSQAGVRLGLATVDLKSASDLVTKEAVFELLPYDWAILLERLRSPCYLYDGIWTEYSKHSSMGNGYTFELESVIFYGLAWACTVHNGLEACNVSVYGDDIILPSAAAGDLFEVLDHFGFVVNKEKSFVDGDFRESCGKHYFRGRDVTPIYQKEVPDVLAEVYRLANRLRRAAYGSGAGVVSDSLYRSAWLAAIYGLELKHILPLQSEEDTGLLLSQSDHDHFGVPLLPYGSKRNLLVPVPVMVRCDHSALLAYWLRFVPEEPFEGRLGVRGCETYAVRRRRIYHVTVDASWV